MIILLFSRHIYCSWAQDLCDEIVVLHDGVLRHVPQEKIHSPQFESDIIALLQEQESGSKLEKEAAATVLDGLNYERAGEDQ